MSEQEAWTMVNKIAKLIEERDALVAERDALQAFKDEALQTDWIARAEAAEAERDRYWNDTKDQIARAEAAEARVTELEAALRQVERHAVYFDDEINPEVILGIVRAALGKSRT